MTNHGTAPVYGIHVFERFDEKHVIGPMYIRKLNPGETASARYICQFSERGSAQFAGFEVRSRFPLPFFEWRQNIENTASAFVYPEPLPGRDEIVRVEGQQEGSRRRSHKKERVIREVVHGRRCGQILWKLSAKKQKWIESVPAASRAPSGITVIDIVPRQTLGADRYEKQISQITSLVLEQIQAHREGEIRAGSRSVDFGEAPGQRRRALEMLAMV